MIIVLQKKWSKCLDECLPDQDAIVIKSFVLLFSHKDSFETLVTVTEESGYWV